CQQESNWSHLSF
nr:immunoglobulin light chain junction region [Macaca mulatta]MOW08206.1 immunoglobulin light chain junction region [Macaca mulatta]MOW08366.1 immunoglobulin light chain junction region [Macaca mulatta]MOW08385.1 immunoglobulin light chain junction region [Macaca mulatta]MOW08564.1 immunoglobulin light chain junction region [Macaca mulatta]